jgi:hypothetical protein
MESENIFRGWGGGGERSAFFTSDSNIQLYMADAKFTPKKHVPTTMFVKTRIRVKQQDQELFSIHIWILGSV